MGEDHLWERIAALKKENAERRSKVDEMQSAIMRLPEPSDGDGPDERVSHSLAMNAELRAEIDEYDVLTTRLGTLLTGVVNAIRGEPPELTMHSTHDAPELAAKLKADLTATLAQLIDVDKENAELRAELERVRRSTVFEAAAEVRAMGEALWDKDEGDKLAHCVLAILSENREDGGE